MNWIFLLNSLHLEKKGSSYNLLLLDFLSNELGFTEVLIPFTHTHLEVCQPFNPGEMCTSCSSIQLFFLFSNDLK